MVMPDQPVLVATGQQNAWIARVLGVIIPAQSSEGAGASTAAPPDLTNIQNAFTNMRLAIIKIGGRHQDEMNALANEISALMSAGKLSEARLLMDKLSTVLVSAQKDKDAGDLQKQLNALKARIGTCGAIGPVLRGINKLATDAQGSIDSKDIATAKAAIRKLTDQLEKIAPVASTAEVSGAREELAALIDRIAAVTDAEPPKMAMFAQLAAEADAHLKVDDAAATAKSIAALREALEAQEATGEAVVGASGGAAGVGDIDGFRASWNKAVTAWQGAIEQVDGQIAKLQAKLRNSPDQRLQGIAERGMNDITGNYKVKVMAAVRGLASANWQGVAKVGPAVVDLVEDFQDFLDKDARVRLCDKNPFDVPIGIRDTLGAALADLAAALRHAGAANT
jgi:hypothetical protein